MTEITYLFVVDTLGKMRALGDGLWIHCNTYLCYKHTAVDLDALIARLGEDHGCMHDDLVGLFYCSDCRAAGRPDRNVGFTYHSGRRCSE